MLFFKQLFDVETSTYTYILADAVTQEAVIIDPVFEHVERDLNILASRRFKLKYILDTHVHADHVTGAGKLREITEAKTVVSKHGGAPCADIHVDDGDTLIFGNSFIRVIGTSGHTLGCVSYLCEDKVFTGDALLINGCGRTDFQNGNAEQLYLNITQKLFTLPDETLVYPGHDYNLRRVSSIGEQKETNPRLAHKTLAEFVEIMNNLNLPKPKHIEKAVPANRQCGHSV